MEVRIELLRPHVDAALHRLLRPAPRLTPRQVEVVRLVREGLSDAQIAHRMGVTASTVGKHLEHVYARTGARAEGGDCAIPASPAARSPSLPGPRSPLVSADRGRDGSG